MGEWWNKMHVLPRTQPGMSRVLSPLSPAPVKVSSQGAAPGPWSRPLPHAERKHWRGVQRNRLYPVKQPQVPWFPGCGPVSSFPPLSPETMARWRLEAGSTNTRVGEGILAAVPEAWKKVAGT